ncbi:MAG: Ig-like domain-containing protein [Ignavibacteriales bacterium]|nr:Ig-like domain-containing protein [Ignavibacteriales bacterium]
MARKSKLIFLLLSIIIARCANQLPPGGGEVDKVSPQILEVFPLNGAINYKGDYFEITFSEYVEKRSAQEAIFISPPIGKGVEYDWSGRTLSVYFKDTLKENTTYTITIGADVADLNNHNKMEEPFTFAFSTGSQVDNGTIAGKVYDDEPVGVMVFAYKHLNDEPDPTNQKPDYISQVGKNGKYTLLGLGLGKYDLFAFKDRLRDFKYARNEDEYGVQFKEIILSTEKNKIENVDFFLTIEDTLPPSISNVRMNDANHLLVEFTEPVDSSKISVSNFYIYDSTAQKQRVPKYFFKGSARDKQFFIGIADSLIPQNNYYLVSEKIIDRSGNLSGREETQFSVKTEKDTVVPSVSKIIGQYQENKIDYDEPVVTVKFDDGVELNDIEKKIVVEDSKKIFVPFDVKRKDDAEFDIRIGTNLKQKTDYELKIDLRDIKDASGNKRDTVYESKFTTASELDFSGVSGNVVNSEDSANTFVVLKSVPPEKNIYKQKVKSNKTFSMKKIVPGKYLLWSFIDSNNDSVYSYGSVKPFKQAEKFTFYPDTLNLRARWPVGEIILNQD